MQDRRVALSNYRLGEAEETLQVARDCLAGNHYRDALNRSYYAAFYAVKSVLALDEIDFKRHKDVVGYFNKAYVSVGKLPKDVGRKLARLQQKREKSDYDDFFVVSMQEAIERLRRQH